MNNHRQHNNAPKCTPRVIKRLFRLAALLSAGRRYTVPELVDALGISGPTVQRDLSTLGQLGILTEFDRISETYRLERTVVSGSVRFTDHEAVAVMLVAENMADLFRLPDARAAASAGRKLERMLPASQRDRISPLLRKVCRGANDSQDADQHRILTFLRQASMSRRTIRIACATEDSRGSQCIVLEPRFLAHFDRRWHLIATDPASGTVDTYPVDRIIDVTPADSGSRRPLTRT